MLFEALARLDGGRIDVEEIVKDMKKLGIKRIKTKLCEIELK